jgi:hypothetical protein
LIIALDSCSRANEGIVRPEAGETNDNVPATEDVETNNNVPLVEETEDVSYEEEYGNIFEKFCGYYFFCGQFNRYKNYKIIF